MESGVRERCPTLERGAAMMPQRDPGTQLPLLIDPHCPVPEIDVGERLALLLALRDRLNQWDGPDGLPAPDDALEDIHAQMSESRAAMAKLGVRVEYRTW